MPDPQSHEYDALFNDDGQLAESSFSSGALELLHDVVSWLEQTERSVFLPIDLMLALLRRGHSTLRTTVANAAGLPDDETLDDQLADLARRVERDNPNPPALNLEQFSLGFTGILGDALAWAHDAGRKAATEEDLVRVVRWRAELQESASIRWAIRQLAQPGGDALFDADGALRRNAFEPPIWLTLIEAMRLSCATGLGFLGTPQMMAALCLSRGLLAEACTAAGVRPRKAHDDLLAIVGRRSPRRPEFELNRQTLTPRLVRMLVFAVQTAAGRSVAEPEVLQAFLADGGSSLELMRALGIVPHIERAASAAVPGGTIRDNRVSVLGGATSVDLADNTPTLDQLGRDLTADARDGNLPTVLGREAELQRVINVLMRSEQRNPLLTGEAGVGKTALAVALAQRIADGTVPESLRKMRVVEINGASLVGGTSYRGELEARIKALLHECEDDVVLFIDEAHAVFAPRSSSGQPAEIPNHFKAALASGKIAVVAATTEAEFRRWMEEDPALRRRFERIVVEELSPQLSRNILADLAPHFEARYEVPVTPEAVDAAIELSVRFMPEQSLPDKAKKLLMDATIAVAAERASSAVNATASTPGASGTPNTRVVSRIDVARQVALKTGAPLDRVARGAISWWVGLEDRLSRHVVGQDRAAESVARSLVAGRLQAAGQDRPQSVLVFAGPPGVGKVGLAKAMAEEIYGSRDALIRLEMSDFQEAHSLSRLIGSPPGYVGYQDEDALVTPLRRRPSSVVLLEDFTLAHPRVQDRIVRLFREGEIADTRGLKADARHAIFVLTVEIEPQSRGSIGFGAGREESRAELAKLAPELHDRLKGYAYELIAFDGLKSADAELGRKLLDARIAEFKGALREEYGIDLIVPSDLHEALVEEVQALADARGIDRLFRQRIVDPVSEQLLAGVQEPVLDTEKTRA